MTSPRHDIQRLVVSLLVAGAIFTFAGLVTDTHPAVDWDWLQAHSHQFYVIKALLAGLGVVLVIAHMNQVWKEAMSIGQRLRYVALFYLITVLASFSVADAQNNASISARNILGLGGALLVLVAMIVSMREAHSRRP